MAKTNASFRLSKTAKRMIALMGGPKEGRDQYKRMMIEAEHAASIVPKISKGDKRPQGTASYVTNDTGTASTQV